MIKGKSLEKVFFIVGGGVEGREAERTAWIWLLSSVPASFRPASQKHLVHFLKGCREIFQAKAAAGRETWSPRKALTIFLLYCPRKKGTDCSIADQPSPSRSHHREKATKKHPASSHPPLPFCLAYMYMHAYTEIRSQKNPLRRLPDGD